MESLKMLESEEGQLNAVFACYGSAMQHGQLFEQALKEFLVKYKKLTNEELAVSEIVSVEGELKERTIGQLLHSFFKKVEIDDLDVQKSLSAAHKKRNMLAHEYFLTRDPLFATVDGRMKLLQELVTMDRDFSVATALVNGMGIAIEKAVKGERTDEASSKTLFTIRVQLNDRNE